MIEILSSVAQDRRVRDADVCVIGAGIAGLVVTRRALQRGLSVVLLESGSWDVSDQAQELNELDAASDSFASAIDGRFRGLGGSSSRWGGKFMPLTAAETGARPHLDLPAWPLDVQSLERYRGFVEGMFGLPDGSYEEDGLEAAGFGHQVRRNDPDFQVRLTKWAAYSNVNLGQASRVILQANTHCSVVLEATVVNYGLDEGGRLRTVTGTDGKGNEITVGAGTFVLCTGAVEVPRQLLHLDRQYDGRVFSDNQALGRYLSDDVGIEIAAGEIRDRRNANEMFGYHFQGGARRNVHLDLAPETAAREGIAAAFCHVTLDSGADPAMAAVKKVMRSRQTGEAITGSDLADLGRSAGGLTVGAYQRAVRRRHHWSKDLAVQMEIWIEQLPDRANQVTLGTEVDRLGVPKALVHWGLGDAEEAAFRSTARLLRDYWRRHRLDQVMGLRCVPELADDDGRLRDLAVPLFHPWGAARMGTDPRESVVDASLSCHAIPNLKVISSAVFPSGGATGPTYTIALMAAAVADAL